VSRHRDHQHGQGERPCRTWPRCPAMDRRTSSSCAHLPISPRWSLVWPFQHRLPYSSMNSVLRHSPADDPRPSALHASRQTPLSGQVARRTRRSWMSFPLLTVGSWSRPGCFRGAGQGDPAAWLSPPAERATNGGGPAKTFDPCTRSLYETRLQRYDPAIRPRDLD
jgi:hypothetical protein